VGPLRWRGGISRFANPNKFEARNIRVDLSREGGPGGAGIRKPPGGAGGIVAWYCVKEDYRYIGGVTDESSSNG